MYPALYFPYQYYDSWFPGIQAKCQYTLLRRLLFGIFIKISSYDIMKICMYELTASQNKSVIIFNNTNLSK